MVTSVTSFGRSGLSDWLVQRVTAVILAVYTVFIIGFLVANPDIAYADWKAFFSLTCVRIFTLLALLSTAAHAWIGLWSVTTDYFTVRMMGAKGNLVRWAAQAVIGLGLFTYVVWGIQILWGL